MRRPNGEPSIEPVVELQRETYGVGKILRGLNVALKLCRALREYKFEDTRSYRLYTCRGLVCLFSQSLCHDQGLMLCYHGHVLSKLLYFYNLPFIQVTPPSSGISKRLHFYNSNPSFLLESLSACAYTPITSQRHCLYINLSLQHRRLHIGTSIKTAALNALGLLSLHHLVSTAMGFLAAPPLLRS